MRPRTLLFLATSVAFLAVLWCIFRTHTTTTNLEARLIVAQHTRDRLSTELQHDKFKDIVAAEVARETDITAAAKAQGLEFNDPVIKKLADDSQKQMETELLAVLGEKNFQAYQEFDRTASARGFVGGFAVQMAMTEPLTPTQGEQLAKALIAAAPAAEIGRHVDPGKVNWSMVDRRAEQFLSPTQLAAWKLGAAHNPAGGSRLDHELKKAYDTAIANTQKKPGS